jgi:hypothetical protein
MATGACKTDGKSRIDKSNERETRRKSWRCSAFNPRGGRRPIRGAVVMVNRYCRLTAASALNRLLTNWSLFFFGNSMLYLHSLASGRVFRLCALAAMVTTLVACSKTEAPLEPLRSVKLIAVAGSDLTADGTFQPRCVPGSSPGWASG